uniref:Putative udp-glucuronosyltransferase n=1 Tax=Corethrella appendiculata TaxID=1370023 RepID=U5EXU4_9DIPT
MHFFNSAQFYLFIVLTILLAFSILETDAYRILVLVPFPAPSHWLWIEHFVKELLKRGHEVTAITNYQAKEKHSNYTEIIIDPMYDIPSYLPISDIFELRYDSDLQNLFLYWNVGLATTQYALENPNVQQFIEREDLDFDLVISEQFFQESFLMFAHKYRAPIVTIGTLGYSDFMDRNMGLLTPWSFVPHPILMYTSEMTFLQRCYNFIISVADFMLRKWYYLPLQDKLSKKYFQSVGSPETLPSVFDLEKQISVMLINSHTSISQIRPTIPGLVDVAGAHIKTPTKALPKDIKEFLDSATDGAIFFSLGSYVKSADMPKDRAKAFLEVFRNLKQRVLWKYEDDSLHNIPENVLISAWLPQSDILAHKNVILFITHGGIFGSQEGIYHGKPMLYIPFYGDQFKNALKAENTGYALTLKFSDVNTITLSSRINELLTDSTFAKQAKKASELFRDNPLKPMDAAMYWIEYVAHHNGAKHLKSTSVNLNWFQYLMLDVILFFLIIFLALAVIFYQFLDFMFTNFGGTKTDGNNNGSKKKDKRPKSNDSTNHVKLKKTKTN